MSAPSTVNVTKASTTTTLGASPNPVNRRQTSTLTATVTPVEPGSGIATGQVVFKEGKKTVGTAQLVNGQASLNVLHPKAGTHSIVATYAGDTRFLGSVSQVRVVTVTR